MSKIEEICTVSFVDHEAASDLLREFTGKEGGLATVDWYLLRNRIADAISMTRIDEREKCRQLLSEAETREREARVKALEEAAAIADTEEELPGKPSKLVVAAMEAVGPVGNARAAVRTTKASIAKRIRALQSEER